jgi:hypothetical protein
MSDRAAGILTILTIVGFYLLAKWISQFIDRNSRK